MSVSGGFDGYCRRDAWCPVRIVLSNDGPDVEGELHILESYSFVDAPTAAKPVSLPSHSRKAYFIYLPPIGWSPYWKIRLVADGEVLVEQRFSLRVVGGVDPLYVVVGEGAGNLNFLTDVAPPGTSGRVAYTSLDDLPPDPLGWEAVDLLVLADADTSALSLDQRRALETWVAHGGHLVVIGGSGGERTAAGIAGLLPVTVGPVRSVDSLWALEERLGVVLPPGPYILTEATVREGEVLLKQGDLPLIVRRAYGSGVVDFLAFGTGADLFTRWEDGARLWSSLLETTGSPPPRIAFRQGYPAMEAVGSIPDLVAPSVLHLLAFVLVYTLLVGPVNYLVLKRLDRRELAWATIPLLVLAFTGCAYLTGFQIRGRTPIVHRLVAVRVPPGSDVGRVTAAVGIFSPRRATYDLRIAGTGVYQADWDFYGADSRTDRADRVMQEAEGAHVVGVRVDVGGIRPFIAETYADVTPIEADLRLTPRTGGFRLEGSIRNGPIRLTDAVLIVGYEEQRLGDLEPGAEAAAQLDLYASVRTTPGGPPTLAGPYGWGDLPERILGQGEYWTDRDLYRKYQFLSALFPYSGPGLGPGVHLVGWAEEGPPAVEVVDRPSRQRVTALYVYDLPVAMPEEDIGLSIPPSLISCVPEEEDQRAPYDPYIGPHQSVIFRCTPWVAIRIAQVEEMEVTLQGSGEVEVSAWDWEKGDWTVVGTGWGRFTLSSPDAAVSPAGAIRLRVRTGAVPTTIERLEVAIEGQR